MRNFKIYGTKYSVEETTSEAPDAFGYRGKLCDDKPKGKKVGYVIMEDNSIIECYTKLNPLYVILPILFVVVILLGVLMYFKYFQDKDVTLSNGVIIKQGTDNNVVSYNGFMSIDDNNVSVNFQNGNEDCTIQVTGKGIKCEPVSVKAGEYIAKIPATFTTEDGLVQGKIIISTTTSTAEQAVTIEIPGNNTADSSTESLQGYWKGECIYGTSTGSTE